MTLCILCYKIWRVKQYCRRRKHFWHVQVPGIHGATQLALGGAHTIALCQTDDLLAWGANQNGVLGLGIGTSQDARTPMKIPKLTCSQVCCKLCCVSSLVLA